jgi:hypothetical protein
VFLCFQKDVQTGHYSDATITSALQEVTYVIMTMIVVTTQMKLLPFAVAQVVRSF